MMTRDVLLEMELEEDDEEDGDIGERGVSGGRGGAGSGVARGRAPGPEILSPRRKDSGTARGRRTLLGEGGCWDPRQVGGRGTGRRKPAPPACGRNAVASSR